MRIGAQPATDSHIKKKIGCPGDSIFVVDIPEGLISWIHQWGWVTANTTPFIQTDYGISDYRLASNLPEPQIASVRVKSFPLLGKVVDLHWKGEDFGLGIISLLNYDMSIKHTIMRSHDVRIVAHGDYRCWIMSVSTQAIPSEGMWNCYQAIASHLLAEWPK